MFQIGQACSVSSFKISFLSFLVVFSLRWYRLLDRRQLLGLLERIKNVSSQPAEGEVIGGNFLTSVKDLWSAITSYEVIGEERVKHPFSEDLVALLDQLW